MDPSRSDPAIAGRRAAFRAAMDTHRLKPPEDAIRLFRDAAGAVQIVQWWRRAAPAERPTALICTGLLWSLAQAALNEGVRVPGDLSLLSIDDPGPWLNAFRPDQNSYIDRGDVQLAATGQPTDPMAPRFAPLRNTAFSSVAMPFREMGRWAIQEVLRRVCRPELTPLHEIFAARVTSGNTVAPPAPDIA